MVWRWSLSGEPEVVHQTPERFRLKHKMLQDPALDPSFLEALLCGIPGVKSVRVNPRAASLVVCHQEGRETLSAVLDCLGALPPEAFRPGHGQGQGDLADVAGLAVLALAAPRLSPPLGGLLSTLAALPVMLGGLETLIGRGLKAEVLDAAAVLSSLLRRDYSTSNAIVALLALGRHLERTSREKSTDLLKSLLSPQEGEVSVATEAGEIRLPLARLEVGQVVICGPGDKIPVDGLVVSGEAEVNRSALTGESQPIHAEPGCRLTSGAVVEDGRLGIKAEKVGSQTAMAHLGRYLETSLRHRSAPELRSARLADRLAPLGLGLALLLFLASGDLRRSVAVLTVDYGCALKLAAPVAVKTSMFNAGRHGVLIKGAPALEALASVDAVVFDKTGTLTTGDLEVTDVLPLDDLDQAQLLALAAGAEQHYGHPLGKAVVRAARERGLTPPALTQADFIVAHGVSAFVDGERVMVGSRHFIEEDEGIDCSRVSEAADRLWRSGKSILYVAHEHHLEGLIALKDHLRPEAATVLAGLKRAGVAELVVLTGDHPQTAQALHRQLPVLDRVHWELKPEDKARIVEEMKAAGRTVAFVGDGVNDAPALIRADVGVSMPDGSDLARDTAQAILLSDNLEGLLTAREISLRSGRVLENTFRATLGLNSAIMLAAATGRLRPLTAALWHNLTTIGILGYAAAAGLQTPRPEPVRSPPPARSRRRGRPEELGTPAPAAQTAADPAGDGDR